MKNLPQCSVLFVLLLVSGCGSNQASPGVRQIASDSERGLSDRKQLTKPVGGETEVDVNSIVGEPGLVVVDAVPSASHRAEYSMLSWNVESEGADASVIADQLTQLNLNDHYDVFALSEVMPGDFGKFRDALGEHYKYAYSRSGNNDRLQILFNEDRFELVRQFSLDEINILNRYRAPLVVHLKDRINGTEFLVMVNHLARGKAEIRQEQATRLVEWARTQTLPVFALGDYNFDFVFETRKGNLAFANMLRDNIWRWVEPSELIDTNWYDNPQEPDGKDDYPGSILDFVFVAGPAKDWNSVCNVIVREGDFPDDEKTSDHRPIELIVSK